MPQKEEVVRNIFQRFVRFILKLFAAIGALLLLFTIVLYITLAWQMSRDPVVYMDDPDVQLVLQWTGFSSEDATLLNSYHPPTNWAGDYVKIFAVQVDPSAISEIVAKYHLPAGDHLSEAEIQAIRFAVNFTQELPWFPTQVDLMTNAYHVVIKRTDYKGPYVDTAHLMTVHPESGVVYFVAAKM